MTSENQTLFDENFVPNCTVKVSGKHYFADRAFYANPYGLSFFDSPDSFGDNPYIAPACADLPGLFEEMTGDTVPKQKVKLPPPETASAVMRQIDPRYILKKESDAKRSGGERQISCTFEGNLSRQNDSLILQYGAALPCVFCVTNDCVSANLPFSPFNELSFQKDRAVLQSMPYSLPSPDFFSPPEEIILDFVVLTKHFFCSLREDAPGVLELCYVLSVGTTFCEKTTLTIEVAPSGAAGAAKCGF